MSDLLLVLPADLREAVTDTKGFSARNLKCMTAFAKRYPYLQIGQRSAAQLPGFHIITLSTKLPAECRVRYARHVSKQSWSRDTLAIAQLEVDRVDVHHVRRLSTADLNFKATSGDNDLAKLLAQAEEPA